MNRKGYFLFSLLLCCITASAQNLIKDPDFDKPLPHPEIRVAVGASNMSKRSIFTEDLSWNKCLKLEVMAHSIHSKTKKPYHFQRLYIGGDKGNGIKVKPNTVYSYSVELKGNVTPTVFIEEKSGNAKKKLQLKIIKDLNTRNWKIIRGSFKTGPNASSATICVDITAYVASLLPKKGDYLLVDKASLIEKTNVLATLSDSKKIIKKSFPLKKTAAPDKTVSGFLDYQKNTPAPADTQVTVTSNDKAFHIKVKCLEPQMNKIKAAVSQDGSNKIWGDDSVEIFFAPVKKDRSFSQFVISAGGGRWMSYGINTPSKNFDLWSAKISRQSNSWTADIEIPYSLLGWNKRPSSDTAIGFNVARNRKPVPGLTVWNNGGQLRDVNSFGILFVGNPDSWFEGNKKKLLAAAEKQDDKKFAAKIKNWKNNQQYGKLFNESLNFYDELRFLKLKGMSFVLTQINPAADPTIPLVPENIANPPDKISIRAAGNEFKPLPLAITNLSDKLEEYRIVINSFNRSHRPLDGLQSGSSRFPMDHIKLYRGIRMKDGNGKGHGMRFDALAPMDPTQTFIVRPKEATPVWAVFNTAGVKPGKYKGAIRILPLSVDTEKVDPHDYVSIKIFDMPFEIEVLPFELDKKYAMKQSFFARVHDSAKAAQMLIDYGCYDVWLSPWRLKMSFKPDGSVASCDISALVKEALLCKKISRDNGMEKVFRFNFGFNAYRHFDKVVTKKQFKFGTPEWRRAWKNYVTAIGRIRDEAGIDKNNYYVQVYDEIKIDECKETPETVKIVQETLPDAKITVSLAPWQMEPDVLEKLIPYADSWLVWSVKYFTPKYAPFFKKLRAANKEIGFYTCETNTRQNYQKYYRAHAWTALAYGMEVSTMYIFIDNLYWLRDWRTAPFGSYGCLAGDTPIATIRMQCIRVGQNDLRYFKKLKDMFNTTKIKDAGLRQEIADFLETTPQLLGIKEAFDMELAEVTRGKMIDYILRLQDQ